MRHIFTVGPVFLEELSVWSYSDGVPTEVYTGVTHTGEDAAESAERDAA